MSNILYKVKLKPNLPPNKWVSNDNTVVNLLKENTVYHVIRDYSHISKIYNIIRRYVILKEFPDMEITINAFDIIIDDNKGERAPQHNIPSEGKDIVPIAEYKFNHIF